tara:strand:- start:3069 stop:3545 length:477 start_codon:yes stop_codon:yes gene_type:complete
VKHESKGVLIIIVALFFTIKIPSLFLLLLDIFCLSFISYIEGVSFLSKGEEDIIVSQSAFFRRRSSPKEHHAHGEDDDDEETIDDGKTPKLLRLLVRDDAVAQTSVSSHRDRGRLLDAPRRFGRVFTHVVQSGARAKVRHESWRRQRPQRRRRKKRRE